MLVTWWQVPVQVWIIVPGCMTDECTWNNGPDVIDKVQVRFSCVSTSHSSQHASTAALCWQMNLSTDVWLITNHIQQLNTQTDTHRVTDRRKDRCQTYQTRPWTVPWVNLLRTRDVTAATWIVSRLVTVTTNELSNIINHYTQHLSTWQWETEDDTGEWSDLSTPASTLTHHTQLACSSYHASQAPRCLSAVTWANNAFFRQIRGKRAFSMAKLSSEYE